MRKNPYVYNKTIREAFEMLNAWEYERLDIDSTEKIHCSAEYTRNMEKLIRAQKRPLWHYTNTVGKKVAVIALVILFAFGASMSVSAVRKPVVEFIVNVYERFVEIFFGEEDVAEAPCEMDTIYTLGNLPEGYELVERHFGERAVNFVWSDNEGNSIRFSQNTFYSKATCDYENSYYMIMLLSDKKVIIIDKSNRKMLYWNDSEYAFSISVPSYFSADECVRLIDSLCIDNVEIKE